MKPKKISFDIYLKEFYDFIKVNTPGNRISDIATIIFYRIEHGVLIISFKYLGYFIETKIELKLLEDEMEKQFEDSMAIKPEFMDWVNEKYMDNRGIIEE